MNAINGLSQREIEVLNRPFPDEVLDIVKGFTYIPGEYVIERLNEAFNYNWDCKKVYVAEGTPRTDSKDNTVIPVYVGIELTVRSETGCQVSRLGFGGNIAGYGKSDGDGHKGAYTDALKKAAQSLGVGLYIAMDARKERKKNKGGRNYQGGNYQGNRGGNSSGAGYIPAPPGQGGGQMMVPAPQTQQAAHPQQMNQFAPPPPPRLG